MFSDVLIGWVDGLLKLSPIKAKLAEQHRSLTHTRGGSALQGEAYATRNHRDEVTNTRAMTSEILLMGDLQGSRGFVGFGQSCVQ